MFCEVLCFYSLTKGTEITFGGTCKRKIPYNIIYFIIRGKPNVKVLLNTLLRFFCKINFPTAVEPLPMPPFPSLHTCRSTYMGASTPVHTCRVEVQFWPVHCTQLLPLRNFTSTDTLIKTIVCGVMSTFVRSHWSFLLVLFSLHVKWKGSWHFSTFRLR